MITDKSVEMLVNTPSRNIFKTVRCNRFYNGSNIVILGDAAHPFPPVGQGLNIAIMGARWLIEAIEMFPHDLEYALQSYSQQTMLQAEALIDITCNLVRPWQVGRQVLTQQLGLQEIFSALMWKDAETDYKFSHGTYKSSLRALDLLFKLFLLIHILLMAALGSQWFEGLKIMGMNFFLVLAICFYYMSTYHMAGKKMWVPMTVWLLHAGAVAYTLNSVQMLLHPPK